nr:HTH domain-containing protein [Streptomyces fuscichromogenes]
MAELRAAEPSLSLRQMADRLGISRDTVTRDLEEIDRAAADPAPPAEQPVGPVGETAPQASHAVPAVADTDGAVVAETAPPAEPVAEARPAGLPQRMPRRQVLALDLDRWPALRRGLAELAPTGLSPESLVSQAIVVMAYGFREGIAKGHLQPDEPFIVRDMVVAPPAPGRALPRRPVPPAPASGA